MRRDTHLCKQYTTPSTTEDVAVYGNSVSVWYTHQPYSVYSCMFVSILICLFYKVVCFMFRLLFYQLILFLLILFEISGMFPRTFLY